MGELCSFRRPDHDRHRLPPEDPGGDQEVREVGDMVEMQMRQEDHVDLGGIDAGADQLMGRAVPAIEQVVAAAHRDQDGGMVAVGVDQRGPGPEHYDTHPVSALQGCVGNIILILYLPWRRRPLAIWRGAPPRGLRAPRPRGIASPTIRCTISPRFSGRIRSISATPCDRPACRFLCGGPWRLSTTRTIRPSARSRRRRCSTAPASVVCLRTWLARAWSSGKALRTTGGPC